MKIITILLIYLLAVAVGVSFCQEMQIPVDSEG